MKHLLVLLFTLGLCATAGGELKPYSATGTYTIGSQPLIAGTEAPKEVNFYNWEGKKELTVLRDSLGHWWVRFISPVYSDTTTVTYEYKIIESGYAEVLGERINKATDDGWEKDGELKVVSNWLGTSYYQSMKRRKP